MTLPLIFPDDSPRTRRRDAATSHAAADTSDTAGSRRAVLTVLHASQRPLADYQIEQAHRVFTLTPYTPSRLRTARHELVEDGLIQQVGETRTPAGRRTQTWQLTKEEEPR